MGKETENGKQKPSYRTLNAVGAHRSVYVHDNFMPRVFFTSPLFFSPLILSFLVSLRIFFHHFTSIIRHHFNFIFIIIVC